jgi:hypothetical protein
MLCLNSAGTEYDSYKASWYKGNDLGLHSGDAQVKLLAATPAILTEAFHLD